jgi:hypothetical protein
MTTDTDIGPRPRPRRKRPQILTARQFIAKLRQDHPKAAAAAIRQQYEKHCRQVILFGDDQAEALVMPWVIERLLREVKDEPSPVDQEAKRAEQAEVRQSIPKKYRSDRSR